MMPSLNMRNILLSWLWLWLEGSLVAGSDCEGSYSCRLENNLVDQFSRTDTLTACQLHCLESSECEFYSLNSALSVCTLLSSCRTPDFSCSHCMTGPKVCPGDCSPLLSDYGGTWHCFPAVPDLQLPVPDQTICVLQCYHQELAGLTCRAGEWVPGVPGDHQVCNFCPPLPQVEQAELSCSSEFIRPNSSCHYRCESDELYFTGERSRTCQLDGTWSGEDSQFSCHPRGGEQSLLVAGGLYPAIWPDFVSVVDLFNGSLTVNSSVPPLPAGERNNFSSRGCSPVLPRPSLPHSCRTGPPGECL